MNLFALPPFLLLSFLDIRRQLKVKEKRPQKTAKVRILQSAGLAYQGTQKTSLG